MAFREILMDSIRPVWSKTIWSDSTLVQYILRPIYSSKEHSWPVKEYMLWRHQKMILSQPEGFGHFKEGLMALARRLGDDHRFFGGDEPSLLDACVGADLILIPFFLPASHPLHQAFMQIHTLYDYTLHLMQYLSAQ